MSASEPDMHGTSGIPSSACSASWSDIAASDDMMEGA